MLVLDYSYFGQGLTGTSSTQFDLTGQGFKDHSETGPTSSAIGFDGTNAWEQDQSGVVSDQKAGDVLQLAFNEAYRDANLWWRSDYAGARIDDQGTRKEQGSAFRVLGVTPKHGKRFEAWFDTRTHFLARTIEDQGSQTITTLFSDYAPVEGMEIARKVVVDDGSGPENRQTLSLITARVLPRQPSSAYAAPKVVPHDFSILGGAAKATVPFRLINNHIYADVSVNGAKPALFIFDTGGHAAISSRLAEALALKVEGSQTTVGGGTGFAQTGTTRVASLSVGGATVTNQPVTVAGLFAAAPAIEGVDVQGMIGYEFFARFVTRIDYGAHTITFVDPERPEPRDAGIAIPLKFYNQMPVVDGFYDGIPGEFHIDTGARMSLLLTGPFVSEHHLRSPGTRGVEAMTGVGVGGPSYSFVTRGGTLRLGDVTVSAPLAMFSLDTGGSAAAKGYPNNVGGGILKRFVVTLDYGHYFLYLKPVAGRVADLDTFDRSGMWINGDKAGFKIAYVSVATPADQAGLKAGDVIVSVDGTAATKLHLYDLRRRLRTDPPGTLAKLTIARGGKFRDVSMVLRDLL
jgi:hypothetical protein